VLIIGVQIRDNLWIPSSFSWTLSIAYRFFNHCECGKNYNGGIGRPWAMKLREQRQNLEVGHLEISRLAQHSFEETGKNPVYRKFKEVACMTCSHNPVGLPSIEISSVGTC
jgi:hypothetical protein